MKETDIKETLSDTFSAFEKGRGTYSHGITPRETGKVLRVSNAVATVSGLPGAGYEELIKFPGGLYGIALNLNKDDVDVVLLGEHTLLQAGAEAERTGRVVDVPVGNGLIGRIIDPLGEPLDGKGPLVFTERYPVERPAAEIMDRAQVSQPLQTGTKIIDAIIPVGHGQRELILGDRHTGKTTIAIDTILNQKGRDVICIYCAISQRAASIAKVIALLEEKQAMNYTTVVVTEGNNPPGLKFIAPYAATSMAEYFMEQGRRVLIVYDDLTHHARAYRELSLLLRRPPGREAFPGDIFYLHSRLLERATQLGTELGGGSLTALPVIETEAQNMSAYIPTNLISITDGQIYLSPKLFELGVLPAIDIGRSVSRVGGKAQLAVFKTVSGNLKLDYAQFEELESFARFGTRMDDDTTRIIEHGKRIRECLKQPEHDPLSVEEQVLVLLSLNKGLFDEIDPEEVPESENLVRQAARELPADLLQITRAKKKLSAEEQEKLLDVAREALGLAQKKKKDE